MTVFERIKSGEFLALTEVMGLGEDAMGDILPLRFLYHNDMFAGFDGNKKPDPPYTLDLDLVKQRAAEIEPGRIVIINCEVDKLIYNGKMLPFTHSAWDVDPQTLANSRSVVSAISQAVKSGNPSLKLGFFSNPCPTRHTNGFHASRNSGRYDDYQNVEAFLTATSNLKAWGLDLATTAFYFDAWAWRDGLGRPNFNWPFTESPLRFFQDSALTVWQSCFIHAMQLLRGFLPDDLFLPILSPQWWTSSARYHAPAYGDWHYLAWTLTQIQTAKAMGQLGLCDSLAFWIWPKKGGMKAEDFIEGDYWKAMQEASA